MNGSFNFYDGSFIFRKLLTRDNETEMDPEWEGEQLVGKTIQFYKGDSSEGNKQAGKVTAVHIAEDGESATATVEGHDEPVQIAETNAAGDLVYYGNLCDPEWRGADLIGRRIALCECTYDGAQSDPASWVKRPFVISYDEDTGKHRVRFQDNTEKDVALEPKGEDSWRYLLGW